MTSVAAAQPVRRSGQGARRAVGLWLAATAVMVFAMMVIGAITRLTESGLSMVEWRPLIGALPPLTDAEWRRIFELYRQTSQYQMLNAGMSLDEFRTIFWWEYVHRLWGRLIGLVYALPFFWFLATRRIPPGYAGHLWVLLLLGALQGVIGWWMVQSGLVDRTEVSQYRLAVHLGLAFAILGYLLWLALELLWPREVRRAAPPDGLRRLAAATLAVVFVTVLSGALVAGLRAGLVYNEWPLMDGRFFPAGYGDLSPWWINPFENVIAVQFDHRMMAYLTGAAVLATWAAVRRTRPALRARMAADALGLAAIVQIALGVTTLLLVVPLPLAVMHQIGAAALFCCAIWLLYELQPTISKFN